MKYEEMLAFSGFLNKTQGTNSPAWTKAMQDVNQLMEVMGPYQLATGDGSYRPITPEAYKRIEETFDKAVNSVNEFVKEQAVGEEDVVRHQLMKNFNKEFLAKSYIEYKNVKPNPNLSLKDAMENFRYENVDLSVDELRRVGGNLSSRVQLTVDLDGKPTRGVFTKRSAYDPKGQYRDILREMNTKYGKFGSFWATLGNEGFYEEGLEGAMPLLFCNTKTGAVYDATPEMRAKVMTDFENSALLGNFPAAMREFQKYRNDPDFFNALFDFSVKADHLTVSKGINEALLGLKPGDNIDGRNSAMSSVANLMGVGDLIAKSKQLSVHMPDGTHQVGTFMEFVESKDITNLDSIDEMRVCGLDAYEGKEAKRQLADLQVLDYVCGNVDRHLGNILYKFDPQTHKLIGIKGIDNDASFLRGTLSANQGVSQLPSLRQMRVIDEKMAEKLLSIDEGMLSATLHGYGLTEEEISSAYSRLQNLQSAVRGASVYDPKKGLPPFEENGQGYGITIVRSEYWDKLSVNDLQAGNNAFSKVVNVQKTLTNIDMVTQPMIQKAECSKRSLKTMLDPQNSKALLDSAKSHKPMFGVSDRYANVLSALERYQNTPAPEDPLHADADPKWDRLAELKAAVDAYKREKVEIGHINRDGSPAQEFSSKALSRIQDVNKIDRFASALLDQRKQALDADKTLRDAERKQAELDAFKALPPDEQKIILDQKRAHEEYLNQDFSVRVENSLQAEEGSLEDSVEIEVPENNLSADAIDRD